MKLAYADPPYLGCGAKHYGKHHPAAAEWDDVDTHLALLTRLVDEYPDGWALSCNTRDLRWLLPACPDDVRVGAWVKPWNSGFRPGNRVSWSWEPLVWRGGRKRLDQAHGEWIELAVRDSHVENITRGTGLAGAKPPRFNRWVADLLGYRDGDTLDDLFPGTGGMSAALAQATAL